MNRHESYPNTETTHVRITLRMKSLNRYWSTASGLLLLSILACRPVITVGWQEIGILLVLFLVIAGPVLFRLYKRVNEFQNWKNREDKPED